MKNWYESKLVWTGVCLVAIAALEASLDGADWRQLLIAAFGATVIVLRKITTESIK